MKLQFLMTMSIAISLLLACGRIKDQANQVLKGIQGRRHDPTTSEAKSLDGRTYVGTAGQGGKPKPGCEGCGNRGSIEFLQDSRVRIGHPGDDQIFALN